MNERTGEEKRSEEEGNPIEEEKTSIIGKEK
jgi:hypothetical protein